MSEKRPAAGAPGWLIGVIVAALLPLLAWPSVAADMLAGAGANAMMLFVFPGYALLSAWLAYRCYPSRRELTWILLALLAVSYAAAYYMITHTPQLI